MSLPFSMRKVYNFTTVAPSLLGSPIRKATLVGILSYDEAVKNYDITTLYRNILPVLPTGTPNNAKSTTYYKFKTEASGDIVLAEEWIEAGSIEEVGSISFTVRIRNADLDKITAVRNALIAVGVHDFNIEEE